MHTKTLLSLIILVINSAILPGQNHVSVGYFSPGSGNDSRSVTTRINCTPELVEIVSLQPETGKSQLASPSISSFLDHRSGKYLRVATLPSGKIINTSMPYNELPLLTLTDEKEIIKGYECLKATASVFSNRIEIFYTMETGIKATPLPSYGQPEGLVLKIVRNGNILLEASEIEVSRPCDLVVFLPADQGKHVDQFSFDDILRESYVTSVKVFESERISWGNEIENGTGREAGITYRYSGGTIILKRIKVPEFYDGCSLFAEISQYSDGDAYDRTGTIFLVPEENRVSFLDGLEKGTGSLPVYTDSDGLEYQGVVMNTDYLPPVELVRFFTPFGVGSYNTRRIVPGLSWSDSAWYKMDITELLPLMKGEVWLGAFIGNYDRGGHKLSLTLKFYPGSREVTEYDYSDYWVKPIFNTLNILEMSGQRYGTMFRNDSLEVEVDIPEGLENVILRYISTGHGGWSGGDEFNKKLNEIFVDGTKVYEYYPWRSDCATYRELNPASGNFWNGLSSSDYSRSGWCPGTATNPLFIPLGNLAAGKHIIKVYIPIGDPDGNSFSHWSVSGVLLGKYEEK